jgi:hypothetical protein
VRYNVVVAKHRRHLFSAAGVSKAGSLRRPAKSSYFAITVIAGKLDGYFLLSFMIATINAPKAIISDSAWYTLMLAPFRATTTIKVHRHHSFLSKAASHRPAFPHQNTFYQNF